MNDQTRAPLTTLRVGQGYDVHAFCPGDHVVIGGVSIPYKLGVKAHSDGDVLIHSLCDALLGAASLGDIGVHFPDTDPRWKGVDSRHFLRHVRGLLVERGYSIVNVDVTVLADAPRLGSHRQTMQANVAADLGLATDCVNIKATTSEGLGFIGRGEGLACQAVALIQKTAL